MTKPIVKVLPDAAALFRAAADEFTRLASDAVRENGRFTVALSGGSTPRSLYSLLATAYQSAVPWKQIFVFFGDERHVPPDSSESNYKMANDAMLSKVPIPAENVFRIRAENPNAESAAQAYEESLRKVFHLVPGEFPRFDLTFLGMGPDGHTASLFPDSAGLNETRRLVVANWIEKFKTYRITLTLPVLNNSRSVVFLTSGADKAPMLRDVLEGHRTPPYPCQLVNPLNGRIMWMVDEAAAADLATK
jgi:6-phosphogluconolactonase